MKLLLYCTKANGRDKLLINNKDLNLIFLNRSKAFCYDDGERFKKYLQILNDKIVAECDFEVERIWSFNEEYQTNSLTEGDLCIRSCLTTHQKLFDYFKKCMTGNRWMHNGYAIYIKNLKIFDEPRELKDLYSIRDIGGMLMTFELKKAPQNMQRISLNEWEYGTYNSKDMAILISIHPEYLCDILNGRKTIEVRKKVLKCMYKYEWRKER